MDYQVEQAESKVAPKRRARFIATAVGAVGVMLAGVLSGWTAASQKTQTSAAGGHGHAHEGGEDEHAHAATSSLSPRTLANLGVEIGSAQLGDFVRTINVPAEVESLPLSERPVTSPVSGVLRAIHALPGHTVGAGEPLAEVVRDALPQPAFDLTEGILKPLNEDYHAAVVGVRTAALALRLARSERERLSGVAEGSQGVGRVVREAQYAEERAELELANARQEAAIHGLSPEQIETLESGRSDQRIPDVPDVRVVLGRNGLWSPAADELLARLPENLRGTPRTRAILGELVGGGRLTPELLAAVRSSPVLAERFMDVVGLLQMGTTPTSIVAFLELGGLEPVVRVTAPKGGPEVWDVTEVSVRIGARIEAGTPIALLRDDRRMALHLAPAPSDMLLLGRTLSEDHKLRAEPLVEGSGEAIDDVRLVGLTGKIGTESAGATAYAENRIVAERDVVGLGRVRTWALRPGLRFVVKIPLERAKGKFVLPADAIAYQGPVAIVLLQNGDSFRPLPVRLEYHDAQTAVVAADGALFAGDSLVIRGAPALAIALLAASSGGIDPHAGHNH
jgi:multidrug efflux pump subunit AcrA (membrane-fusion protein)